MKLEESENKIVTKYRPTSRPYFKKDDKPVLDDTSKSILTDYEPPKQYEKVIQKLEADVRNHIRVEQQLKLHIETVHNKLEELEAKCNILDHEKQTLASQKDLQIADLELQLKQQTDTCQELEQTLKHEKVENVQKFESLEARILEMEQSYQKEIKVMQTEITRVRDDDQYKSIMSNFNTNEHMNTYTHRKMKSSSNNGSQKQFISHGKAMSISNNSINHNIIMPGSHTTKKKGGSIRKMNNDFQRNLTKG